MYRSQPFHPYMGGTLPSSATGTGKKGGSICAGTVEVQSIAIISFSSDECMVKGVQIT